MSSKHQPVPTTPQLQAASPARAASTPEFYKVAPSTGYDGDESRKGGSLVGSWGKNTYGSMLSYVLLFATLRTRAHQAPLSTEPSRQESWSGLPFLLQGIFPTQGLNPGLLHCRQILYHMNHQGSPSTNYQMQLRKFWIQRSFIPPLSTSKAF